MGIRILMKEGDRNEGSEDKRSIRRSGAARRAD